MHVCVVCVGWAIGHGLVTAGLAMKDKKKLAKNLSVLGVGRGIESGQ